MCLSFLAKRTQTKIFQTLAGRKSQRAQICCTDKRTDPESFWIFSGLFGLHQYGIDINGYVNHPEKGLCLWFQRRSLNKPTWPGMMDNFVRLSYINRKWPNLALHGNLISQRHYTWNSTLHREYNFRSVTVMPDTWNWYFYHHFPCAFKQVEVLFIQLKLTRVQLNKRLGVVKGRCQLDTREF